MSSCCAGLVTPASLDLALLFGTGALLSIGHCAGMCGPLIGAYGCAQRESGGSRGGLTLALGLYHAGRLSTYAALGAICGSIGAASAIAGERAATLQALLALAASALMLCAGLGLVGLFPHRRTSRGTALVARLAGAMRRLFATRRALGRVALGAAQGLLPCGPIYAVLFVSLGGGSALAGATAMLAFGAGTLPLLFALGFGMSRLAPPVRLVLHRAGAALVVLLAVQMGLRGLAALEVVSHARFGEAVLW